MPKLPPPRLIACALLLLSLAPATAARAQGVTPYDTYRDAYGDPHYTANLTPLPDDRTLLGPSVALSDPFMLRTRPTRGYGEIEDITAGFWESQADRLSRNRLQIPTGR